MKIGEFLKQKIVNQGLTQKQVADKLKVSQAQISSYLIRDISVSTYLKLCKASGLDPAETLAQYLEKNRQQ